MTSSAVMTTLSYNGSVGIAQTTQTVMTKRKFRATISTEKLVWDTFVIWAKQQNKSASELITQYMKTAVSNQDYVADLHRQQENLESLLTKLIDARLEARKELNPNQEADSWPKDPNLFHIGSFINDNLDGTSLGSSPGNFRFSSLTSVLKVNDDGSEKLITSKSKKYNIHWQSHKSNNAQSCLVEEIPKNKSTNILEEEPTESHKETSSESLTTSLDHSQGRVEEPYQQETYHDGQDYHDKNISKEDTNVVEDTIDTDNKDRHDNMRDTDDTEETNQQQTPTDKHFDELITDSQLKSRENLSQAKSTVTRWRFGKGQIPQLIQEKYEVVGSRWKLKS